jgi:hypothetical protein
MGIPTASNGSGGGCGKKRRGELSQQIQEWQGALYRGLGEASHQNSDDL